MIDPKLLRTQPERIRAELAKRGMIFDLDALCELDEQKRLLTRTIEEKRSAQNAASLHMPSLTGSERVEKIEEMKKIKNELAELEEKAAVCNGKYDVLFSKLPNLSLETVPCGKDETENVVVREEGKIPHFSFPPRDHVELGEMLGLLDIERASKVTGARFAYLKGKLVLLQFALIQHALKTLIDEKIISGVIKKCRLSLSVKPFIPVLPPVLIRQESFARMARLEPKEERYAIANDDLYLVGSAEHTLGAMHMDEVLDETLLPLRYVGYSTSFRREAGSYGKDTRGILRVHQFDKIEIESFTTKEQSLEEQDLIVGLQEYLVSSLGLPYRVISICSGDLGTPDARQIDLECWMPGQNAYRETHTSDLNTDYQSRRLCTRVRRLNGSIELVHMNDATVFALGRTLIALLENYQCEDGSIKIPKVLQPFCGFNSITAS